MFKFIKAAVGRYRQATAPRFGQQPGILDTTGEDSSGFWAAPNFYYYQDVGEPGRPAWLPLYATPQMVAGTALNAFPGGGHKGWPAESDLNVPISSDGDWLRVVGQYVASASEGCGAVLNNEHVIGSWLTGSFEASAVWNLVQLPMYHVNTERHELHPTLVGFSKWSDGDVCLAWGNDLWLGNTGLRKHLLVGRDAAQRSVELLKQ